MNANELFALIHQEVSTKDLIDEVLNRLVTLHRLAALKSKPKRQGKRYSKKEKKQMKAALQNGRTVKQVAHDYQCSLATIYALKKKYRIRGKRK